MIRFIGVQGRHFVDLDVFEDTVRAFEQAGSFGPGTRHYYPEAELSVCDFGRLQIVGCRPARLPAELLSIATRIYVEGLDELEGELSARGATILQGPEPCEDGTALVVRHADGSTVEYVERARSSQVAPAI